MPTEIIVVIISGLFGLSNFVMFLIQRHDKNKNNPESQMILGLGHDIIITKGEKYIQRGWITRDEYENLNDYLYKPYLAMGGNGTAQKIMKEVDKLPIKGGDQNERKETK